MKYAICPFCLQDISNGNHTWDCKMNPINMNNGEYQQNLNNKCDNKSEKEFTHFHPTWLEFAIKNFKNQNGISHMIDGSTKIGDFIKLWSKDELSKIVEV